MIEVIVASLVFLITFVFCMDMLSRSVSSFNEINIPEAERQIERCIDDYKSQRHPQGVVQKVFEWGEMEISLLPYQDGTTHIKQLTVTARLANSRKTLRYIILISPPDETYFP